MSQAVAAVIPAYCPDPTALVGLVRAIKAMSTPVLVVDDGSPCTFDRALASAGSAGADLLRHHRNAGIARSLNDGLRFAATHGARWLLTVDQDSSLTPDFIPSMLAAVDSAESRLGPDRVGAMAVGEVADASGPISYPVRNVDGVATTEEVIQTGTLWSVDSLTALGGFDERLGMDAVDAAACLALRSAGLVVALAPGIAMSHRLGSSRQVRLFGREVMSSGHSPERRATIIRNRLKLFPREFAQSPVHALRTIRRVVVQTGLAISIEDDRWAKAKGAARGLRPRSTR